MMPDLDPVLIDAVYEARDDLARVFAQAEAGGRQPTTAGGNRYFFLLDQLEPARGLTYALASDGQLCCAIRATRPDSVAECEDFLRHYPQEWLAVVAGRLTSAFNGQLRPFPDKVRDDLRTRTG